MKNIGSKMQESSSCQENIFLKTSNQERSLIVTELCEGEQRAFVLQLAGRGLRDHQQGGQRHHGGQRRSGGSPSLQQNARSTVSSNGQFLSFCLFL